MSNSNKTYEWGVALGTEDRYIVRVSTYKMPLQSPVTYARIFDSSQELAAAILIDAIEVNPIKFAADFANELAKTLAEDERTSITLEEIKTWAAFARLDRRKQEKILRENLGREQLELLELAI